MQATPLRELVALVFVAADIIGPPRTRLGPGGAGPRRREPRLKLVFERSTRRLLGVHVLGTDATELVHVGQAVLRHGGDISEFIDTTFNLPTRSEGYKYEAYDGLTRVEVRAAFGDLAPSFGA